MIGGSWGIGEIWVIFDAFPPFNVGGVKAAAACQIIIIIRR